MPAELEDAEARELQVGGLLPSRGRTRAWCGRERQAGGAEPLAEVTSTGWEAEWMADGRQENGELATLESTLTPLVGRR